LARKTFARFGIGKDPREFSYSQDFGTKKGMNRKISLSCPALHTAMRSSYVVVKEPYSAAEVKVIV